MFAAASTGGRQNHAIQIDRLSAQIDQLDLWEKDLLENMELLVDEQELLTIRASNSTYLASDGAVEGAKYHGRTTFGSRLRSRLWL